MIKLFYLHFPIDEQHCPNYLILPVTFRSHTKNKIIIFNLTNYNFLNKQNSFKGQNSSLIL